MTKTLRFKEYSFVYNPKELSIENRRNLVEFCVPFLGSIVQDMGQANTVIKGKGEFIGKNCIEEAKKLQSMIKNSKNGLLFIPDMDPIDAYLYRFDINLENLPGSIEYEFEFWENKEYSKEFLSSQESLYHIVLSGETLWTIARDYDTTVSDLMKLNPKIRRPDYLEEGQRILIV